MTTPTRSAPRTTSRADIEAQTAPAALLRRWLLYLVAASMAALLVGVGVTLLVRSQFAPTEPELSKADAPRLLRSHSVVPIQLPARLSPVKTRETDAPAQDREGLLEAVGSLAVIHLYQSYLNIGMLADSVENETYTRTEAAAIVQNVAELLTLADVQLTRLGRGILDADDQQALERLRNLSGKLRLQTTTLLSYWTGGETEQVARYHQLRNETWLVLREILGIEQ